MYGIVFAFFSKVSSSFILGQSHHHYTSPYRTAKVVVGSQWMWRVRGDICFLQIVWSKFKLNCFLGIHIGLHLVLTIVFNIVCLIRQKCVPKEGYETLVEEIFCVHGPMR